MKRRDFVRSLITAAAAITTVGKTYPTLHSMGWGVDTAISRPSYTTVTDFMIDHRGRYMVMNARRMGKTYTMQQLQEFMEKKLLLTGNQLHICTPARRDNEHS